MSYGQQDLISKLGLFALKKSRSYYYPRPKHCLMHTDKINDVAFSALLKEIDSFAAQFRMVGDKNP